MNGLAEVIKYGVIYDKDFFTFLGQKREEILRLELSVMEEVILRCCEIKAAVVEADEREADLRRILNYGHTLGHAVEAASDFTIAHGMAVAMGMVAVNEIAVGKSLLTKDDADAIRQLIADFKMPVTIPKNLDHAQMKSFLKSDKKTVAGRPFFVLPTSIGKVIITDDVDDNLVDSAFGV